MSSENIVTGKKFRVLTDAVNKVYDRISFWGKASDVEFNSGSNAQTTLGSITGISDSLTSTSSNVAASAASVKALNDKITELSSNLGKFPQIIRMTSYIPSSGKATLLVTLDVKKFSKIKFNIGYQFYTGDGSAVYWLSSIPTTNREMLNGSYTEIVDGANEISIPDGISYCTIRAETNKGIDVSYPLTDIEFE